jgi:hypothetical protein
VTYARFDLKKTRNAFAQDSKLCKVEGSLRLSSCAQAREIMSVSDKDRSPQRGPFEVLGTEHTNALPQHHAISLVNAERIASSDNVLPLSETHEQTLTRNIDCSNYQRCLNLAATLDWESFSCEGCNGEINESLLWRAGQRARKDRVAKALCGPGSVFLRKPEKE